ncbi:MAG: Jag N-terminal domain-containing protein [Candidatus Omnitrophica bacterium]|nr:Jag N-terminal domain-containing protein [Candidatus Omnitrophota bacterium]
MNQSPNEEIEFYGKTVDAAIQKAVKQLNVPRETLVVKVVSEEKKGLFGMQREKPAKIIV